MVTHVRYAEYDVKWEIRRLLRLITRVELPYGELEKIKRICSIPFRELKKCLRGGHTNIDEVIGPGIEGLPVKTYHNLYHDISQRCYRLHNWRLGGI